jgi:hypothetical protein
MKGRIICILALLWGAVGLYPAQAAVYRWVDADGRTQFGDRPPPDRPAEQLQLRRPPAPGREAAPVTDEQRRELRQKMLDAYRDEREEKRRAREKRAAEEARRKLACVEAKNRVQVYESSAGLYQLRPDGTRRFLSDAESRVSLQRARDQVKRLCRQGG